MCKKGNQDKLMIQTKINNPEYKTLQIEDKIYILFKNKQTCDFFEI